MSEREWGARRGRGGARANSGGKRAGAGRPKTNGEGYIEKGVRLGPAQIARAKQLADELGVKPAEVYRRALHGQVQLGPADKPLRRQTLMLSPTTLDALVAMAGGGDVSVVVLGIFAGEIENL